MSFRDTLNVKFQAKNTLVNVSKEMGYAQLLKFPERVPPQYLNEI